MSDYQFKHINAMLSAIIFSIVYFQAQDKLLAMITVVTVNIGIPTAINLLEFMEKNGRKIFSKNK